MGKVITWLLANIATIFGLVQAIIKALKEILTGVINLISIVLPATKAQDIVLALRDALNAIDGFVESIKEKFVPTV